MGAQLSGSTAPLPAGKPVHQTQRRYSLFLCPFSRQITALFPVVILNTHTQTHTHTHTHEREGKVKLASWTWGPISQPCSLQPRRPFLGLPSNLLLPHAAWYREETLGPPRAPPEHSLIHSPKRSDFSKPYVLQGLYLQPQNLPSPHTHLPRAPLLQSVLVLSTVETSSKFREDKSEE